MVESVGGHNVGLMRGDNNLQSWVYSLFHSLYYSIEKSSLCGRILYGLTFLLFDFVTTKVLFCFYKNYVFSKNWVIFLQTELVRGIHGIFLGVIGTDTRLFRYEANEFAFCITLL